ncbi:molybdopterin dinucleotide binding domain-containing protein [Maribacter litopenaei]|uniref:molybdopterin dinucleotide binding domain-containing protein n=1 Tax=Maribacter litopenaei TaxID=2976127 RepID=UPI0030840260
MKGFESVQKASKGTGYYLPNNVRELDFSKLKNGKAKFSICKLADHHLKPNEFLLMTIRSHDQFNTTIYGLNDRYRGIKNERRVLFMNPNDMEKFGYKTLDITDIVSNYDSVERRANKFLIVPYNIPQGNLGAYFPKQIWWFPTTTMRIKAIHPLASPSSYIWKNRYRVFK